MSKGVSRPALSSDIEVACKHIASILGASEVPHVLLQYWSITNGLHADNYEIYSTHEIAERNESYEVKRYCPGYILFANDAGDKVALLRLGGNEKKVYLNYGDDMSTESMEDIGMDFSMWIEAGCPFGFSPTNIFSAIDPVVIRLDKLPSGGLSGLMKIKRVLMPDISVAKFIELSGHLPMEVCVVSYIKALRILEEFNNEEEIFSLWSKDRPSVKMPSRYNFNIS